MGIIKTIYLLIRAFLLPRLSLAVENLVRWVEWAWMRRNPGHADVLDTHAFAEQGIVLQSAVAFRLKPHARVDTVRRSTAGVVPGKVTR